MDQNMTVAVGPPPVEFEYRRLTREELDAILAYQTFMRAPSGNFEHIGLRGGGTVEPYYYDFHGISQPAPRVVYLKVQKADHSRVDLEVGTEGDNVAQSRQNAALKASRRNTLNRLAGAAGRPALSYDEAVQLAVDALKDQRELLEQLASVQALRKPETQARQDAEARAGPRAKMEGDGKAEFLDVWLRELGEDRQWLGSTGGLAFGPARDQKTEPPGLGCGFSTAQLALPEVFVRMAAGARRQRVCVVQRFHRDREVPGFFDDTQFIPLSLCIVEDVVPHGFQEADLGELQVGQQVIVREDVTGEPMWVTVVAGRRSPDSHGMCLGYYRPTEEGGAKFTPFTRETYVKKTRGAP